MELLEKLDLRMKDLCLELLKYDSTLPSYKEKLLELYNCYYMFKKTFNELNSKSKNTPYFLKYASIDEIESLLSSKEFLGENRPTSR